MIRLLVFVLCLSLTAITTTSFAAQEAAGGAIKGKVRGENGASADGVTVTARQGERDVSSTTTNAKGDFIVGNLPAGVYTFVFRKPGLRVGTIQGVEVKTGKTRSLRDRLILPIDEGTLAFVRGSVFDPTGRSVPGASIEIARVNADGTARRFDGRLSDATGSFAFRLDPQRGTYRITAKRDGAAQVSKDVEIDGAMTYRVALTLQPRAASAN